MAGMTASAIRKYVRDMLDVDELDIPSDMLDVWMRDAVTRIISYFDESPTFLQVEYSFDTVPNKQSYDLDTLNLYKDTSTGIVPLRSLQVIDEVRGQNFSLTPRQHRQVRETYYVASQGAGRPVEFSMWGRSLFLWPKPVAIETHYLLGIRQPNWNWITSDSTPDLPEEFHILVAQWALARAYAQQDDPEMANFYREEFAGTLASTATRFVANATALPMIMNAGARDRDQTSRTLGPLFMTPYVPPAV